LAVVHTADVVFVDLRDREHVIGPADLDDSLVIDALALARVHVQHATVDRSPHARALELGSRL
jgi:hypothetical protein